VKLSENGDLVMHDQLQDMGRKIARKNRLWDSKKESFQCLQHKEVIITIPHGDRMLF
jgi:hypothetical protein